MNAECIIPPLFPGILAYTESFFSYNKYKIYIYHIITTPRRLTVDARTHTHAVSAGCREVEPPDAVDFSGASSEELEDVCSA